jgi:hypothetical protein
MNFKTKQKRPNPQPLLREADESFTTAKESEYGNPQRARRTTPGGGVSTPGTETPRISRQVRSDSLGTQSQTATHSSSRSGSARRVQSAEFLWFKHKLKVLAAGYIFKALEISKMSRAELAGKLGVSEGRVNQLMSINGPHAEYERVPLDLLYQIAHVTKVPLELPSRIIPPRHLKDEPPIVH